MTQDSLMQRCFKRSTWVLSLTSLLLATAAAAAPTSLSRLSTQHEFSSDDTTSIQQYVDLHGQALTLEDPSAFSSARAKLIGPLKGPTAARVSPSFREIYSEILIPKLRSNMSAGQGPSNTASMQIAGYLGTDAAAAFIAEHLDVQNGAEMSTRLWATAALRDLIANANVSSATLEAALQSLAIAAATEPSWAVQRQAFVTFGSAIRNTRKVEEGRDLLSSSAQRLQGRLLTEVIARIKSGEPTLILAVEPATGGIRDQYLDRTMFDRQKGLAVITVPALANLHGSVLEQWDNLRMDPRLAQSTELALHKAEVLMALMDSRLTNDQVMETTAYEGVLTNNQRSTLESAQQVWSDIVAKPRYQ